jgi:hypothetical protein
MAITGFPEDAKLICIQNVGRVTRIACGSQPAMSFSHPHSPSSTTTMPSIGSLAAQTLAQDTHIVYSPSPSRDIAPSTSVDTKIPVYHDIDDFDSDSDGDHYSRHRRRPLPPLPDLRFEQSYMASIAPANGVWWKILLITIKDQVFMPLLQGLGFNLALFGWRWWNRGIKFSGAGLGGRFPRL